MTRRCVICAGSGELHSHHVGGRDAFADVEVPVCQTRHTSWHRSLRAAGARIGPNVAHDRREELRAIALGVRVILEDGAALCEDPAAVRARIRAGSELALALIDSAHPAGSPGSVARAARTPGGMPRSARARDCLPRAPVSPGERSRRLQAFLAGMLPAIAELLEEILPAELRHLRTPERIASLARATLPGAVAELGAILSELERALDHSAREAT